MRRTIFVDLDHTLLATEDKLFPPLVERLAEISQSSLAEARSSFSQANDTGFTWSNWFARLALPESRWAKVRSECEADIAARAPDCLYSDVMDVLEECRQAEDELVLISAGDPHFQSWKVGLLRRVKRLFRPKDRYYVPMKSSKAKIIARYSGLIRTFLEDAPHWLAEVKAQDPNVDLIRAMWSSGARPDPRDGVDWSVARNAIELRRRLNT